MLALSPATIEVQMFRKIVAVAALCLPTFAQAEVIEFTCNNGGPPEYQKLQFDTVSQKIRYARWPLSVAERWGQDVILWAAFSGEPDSQTAALFMFKRGTSELIVTVLSSISDKPNSSDPIQCSRPF